MSNDMHRMSVPLCLDNKNVLLTFLCRCNNFIIKTAIHSSFNAETLPLNYSK